MRPSGRDQDFSTVVVDEYFKSSSYDVGKECDEKVEDHLVANKKVVEVSTENIGHVERFGKDT